MAYKDKEKQKEFQRNWIMTKKHEFLNDKKCERCGSKEELGVFNAKSSKKSFSWSYSKKVLEEKLKSCRILCDKHLLQELKGTLAERSITHGRSHERYSGDTYVSWLAMKARCFNPNQDNYYYYGGRGITVCSRWKNSFPSFVEDMGERPLGMTLDRIDPNGNYEPNNCRWASAKTQGSNRRSRKQYETASL